MIFHVLPYISNRQAYYQHIPPWINKIFPEYQVQEAGETNKCSKHFLSSTLLERSILRARVRVEEDALEEYIIWSFGRKRDVTWFTLSIGSPVTKIKRSWIRTDDSSYLKQSYQRRKDAIPSSQREFCRYGVQKDVQHDGQMIDRRSALRNSGLPKMLEYA